MKEDTIQHDGLTRTFSYYVPENTPDFSPLIIVLHRSKSNGSDLRKMMAYRYEKLAGHKQFVVLYPDGYEGYWNDCRKAPNDSAHNINISDTDFIKTLIEMFIEQQKVDPSRIYITGMSGGGHMAFRLAKEIPGKIAAIAPMLAQIPTNENSVCGEIDNPVPVFLLSGTNDPISPFDGGEVSLFGMFLRQGKVLSVDESVNHFIKINGINSKHDVTIVKSKPDSNQLWIEKRVWKEKGKPDVWHYIVHGGGHTLPGVEPLPRLFFGKTCDSRNIADEIIDFFWMHKTNPIE